MTSEKMIQRFIVPTDNLIVGADGDEREMLLRCPLCQFEYTHHEKTVEYQRREDHPVIAVFVQHHGCIVEADVDPPYSGRRGAVVLTFSCENGHRFDLQFVQHKGQTYIRAIPRADIADA